MASEREEQGKDRERLQEMCGEEKVSRNKWIRALGDTTININGATMGTSWVLWKTRHVRFFTSHLKALLAYKYFEYHMSKIMVF